MNRNPNKDNFGNDIRLSLMSPDAQVEFAFSTRGHQLLLRLNNLGHFSPRMGWIAEPRA